MKKPFDLENCRAFINCHLQSGGNLARSAPRPAITLSRQAGSGAAIVAAGLADYLQTRGVDHGLPWTVFDRNLVEAVLAEHKLPESLANFMPEDRITEFRDWIEEIFGLHPPSSTLVRQTAETILHLADLGGVIIIGRGSSIITSKMSHVLHVRLVASLETRIARIQREGGLDADAAARYVESEDQARARYIRKYFHKDINDPLLYHLTLNTDLLPCDQAAVILGEIVSGAPFVRRSA